MSMKVQNRGMVFLPHQHKANPQLTHTNSTIDKFMGGESADYILVAEEWPTFLYDEESGWNIKDIRRGLFHGHILARVSSIHPMIHHLNQRGTPCIPTPQVHTLPHHVLQHPNHHLPKPLESTPHLLHLNLPDCRARATVMEILMGSCKRMVAPGSGNVSGQLGRHLSWIHPKLARPRPRVVSARPRVVRAR